MEKEEEIKELKSRLSLIETFYEESNFIKRMKFYIKYLKEKRRNANNTNDSKNDATRNNTISNSGNDSAWNNEIDKLFNNEKVEKENKKNDRIYCWNDNRNSII